MLLAISRYDAAETASWLSENDWSYPLLCDGAGVVKRYGVLNPEMDRKPGYEGLPHPATFIIDKRGIIRFKQVYVDYKQRTTAETIIRELDKIDEQS